MKPLSSFIQIITIIFMCFAVESSASSKKSRPEWIYLKNRYIKIGVDKSRGACIGYLSKARSRKNVLNHFDEGRFIQQSYYGQKDGSNWNGNPWVYNPVQGGSWNRTPSKLLELKVDKRKLTLYAKIMPRRWSSGELCPEAIMEQWISLKDKIVKIRFKMTYTGPDQGKPRHQEMPAVFVDGAMKTFVYLKDGKEHRPKVGILAENGKPEIKGLRYGKAEQQWTAYLNKKGWGIGIYTPGTTDFTCYRALGDGKTGPDGSSCSYVAPLKTFALTKGLTVEYDVYLTLGKLSEITKNFYSKNTHNDK